MWHSVLPDLLASPRASSCEGGCKVHNFHCCICSSGVSPLSSIYSRSLMGFYGWFTSYIVLANYYVNHLYFYYLPTSVLTSYRSHSNIVAETLSTLLFCLIAAQVRPKIYCIHYSGHCMYLSQGVSHFPNWLGRSHIIWLVTISFAASTVVWAACHFDFTCALQARYAPRQSLCGWHLKHRILTSFSSLCIM